MRKNTLDYALQWSKPSLPFLTPAGKFTDMVSDVIEDVSGITCRLSTDGGTSDGRFIRPAGAETVELGPVNATIHKLNECVRVDDLDTLSAIYQRLLERLLA